MADELIRLAQAVEATGMTPITLRRRIAEAGVRIYRDPTDRRRRLVRRDDVTALVDLGEPILLKRGGC